MDDRSSCLAADHNHMFNDTGELGEAFYADFDDATIQKKRAMSGFTTESEWVDSPYRQTGHFFCLWIGVQLESGKTVN